MDDAKTFASHAGRKDVETDDFTLAVRSCLGKYFTQPLPREASISLGRKTNSTAIPVLVPNVNALPPESEWVQPPNVFPNLKERNLNNNNNTNNNNVSNSNNVNNTSNGTSSSNSTTTTTSSTTNNNLGNNNVNNNNNVANNNAANFTNSSASVPNRTRPVSHVGGGSMPVPLEFQPIQQPQTQTQPSTTQTTGAAAASVQAPTKS